MKPATTSAPATAQRLVSLSAAARELGVSRQALRKHLDRDPTLNLGAAGTPLVDVAQLRSWRAANLNPFRQAAPPVDAVSDDASDQMPLATALLQSEIFRGRREALELEVRRRNLVPVGEPTEIIRFAQAFLREGWRRGLPALQKRLARTSSAPGRTRLLEAAHNEQLRTLAAELGFKGE